MGDSENIQVVFIGEPGSGKSSVINILLGKEQCEAGQTLQLGGKTKESQDCSCFIFTSTTLKTETNGATLPEKNDAAQNIIKGIEKEAELIGTTNDTSSQTNELKTKVVLIDTPKIDDKLKSLCTEKKGFNAFALICPLTRYDQGRIKFLKDIVSTFGQLFFSRCILILTQRSKEQEDENELENQIKEVSEMDKNLQKIFNENGYLLCPNFEFEKSSERYDSFRHSFANSLSKMAFRCFKDSRLQIKPVKPVTAITMPAILSSHHNQCKIV